MPYWDGIMAGLVCGELASWADLAHSDGVVVAVDLHMAKMGVAMGLHIVRQRWWWRLVKLEG